MVWDLVWALSWAMVWAWVLDGAPVWALAGVWCGKGDDVMHIGIALHCLNTIPQVTPRQHMIQFVMVTLLLAWLMHC